MADQAQNQAGPIRLTRKVKGLTSSQTARISHGPTAGNQVAALDREALCSCQSRLKLPHQRCQGSLGIGAPALGSGSLQEASEALQEYLPACGAMQVRSCSGSIRFVSQGLALSCGESVLRCWRKLDQCR